MSVRCISGLFVVLLSLPVYALDLQDAYVLALRNDPSFQAALKEHEAGLEDRSIGLAALLPTLNYNYSNSENDSEVTQLSVAGDPRTNRSYRSYSSNLTLQQPLFDYGAWARYRQGVAKALMADERFRSRSQELLVRLFSAYSEALLAAERQELAQAQRRAYAGRLELNEKLIAGGEGTRTDLLETSARHELALAQQIEAEDALDSALRELQSIVGEPLVIEDLPPLGDSFVVQPLQPTQYDAWRQLTLASNAELASQRHALEVAEQNVQSKVASHLPKLSLYASSRLTSSDSESSYNQKYDTESIGIQLSVPLFAGGGAAASTRQASRQLDQASHELDKLSADTLNELRRQYNLCVSSVAKIRAYELAVKSARALIDATQKSVAGGERVNLDVLDAEQQHHDARVNLADARHSYLRAWLQLHYLAGVLSEDNLNQLGKYFAAKNS